MEAKNRYFHPDGITPTTIDSVSRFGVLSKDMVDAMRLPVDHPQSTRALEALAEASYEKDLERFCVMFTIPLRTDLRTHMVQPLMVCQALVDITDELLYLFRNQVGLLEVFLYTKDFEYPGYDNTLKPTLSKLADYTIRVLQSPNRRIKSIVNPTVNFERAYAVRVVTEYLADIYNPSWRRQLVESMGDEYQL